jgi:hypothetical protein
VGGRGSTRWGNHHKKPLVEGAICIDFLAPEWKEILSWTRADGKLEWRYAGGGPRFWTNFWLAPPEPHGSRRLYLARDEYEPRELIILDQVKVGFSTRVYARCPRRCGRRARKLYQIPGKREFACWRCAGLQYESAQGGDKRINDARRDPQAFMEGREHLRTPRSESTTSWIFLEAEKRGCLWAASPRYRKILLEELPPVCRARLEQLPFPPPRRRLPKRQDRLSGFRRGSAGRG